MVESSTKMSFKEPQMLKKRKFTDSTNPDEVKDATSKKLRTEDSPAKQTDD